MKPSGRRYGIAVAVTVMALLVTSGVALAECGKVTVGEMNWNSARVIANVEKFVLEVGYGCEVELVQTATVPAMTSMVEKGEPDVASEIWINSVRESFDKGLAEGRIVSAGNVLSDGGVEAWWVPAYFAEANPDIRTVKQVMDNAHLFQDPEDPSKGRFYNCPSGWACKSSTPICSEPMAWERRSTTSTPAPPRGCPAPSPRLTSGANRGSATTGRRPPFWANIPCDDRIGRFRPRGPYVQHAGGMRRAACRPLPPSAVLAVTTKAFANSHPDEFAFLGNISFPNDVMNAVLAWGEDNQAEGNEMAGYFMVKHEELWTSWLPADVAARVKAALQ